MKSNPIREWISSYMSHHPDTTPAPAWNYLTRIAVPLGMLPIRYDAERDVLVYTASQGGERVLGRRAFARKMQRMRAGA